MDYAKRQRTIYTTRLTGARQYTSRRNARRGARKAISEARRKVAARLSAMQVVGGTPNAPADVPRKAINRGVPPAHLKDARDIGAWLAREIAAGRVSPTVRATDKTEAE